MCFLSPFFSCPESIAFFRFNEQDQEGANGPQRERSKCSIAKVNWLSKQSSPFNQASLSLRVLSSTGGNLMTPLRATATLAAEGKELPFLRLK